MKNNIKSAFDAIHAENSLKDRTKSFVSGEISRRTSRSPVKRFIPALACCLLLILVCLGGYRLYFTATSVISIDINPSVEIGVNRFNKVITVEGQNYDGQDLAASLDIKFMDYDAALKKVFSSDSVYKYLSQGEIMSITVVSSTTENKQSGQILECVSAYSENSDNTYCYSATEEEVAAAHSSGLSYGKYRAFLELQSVAPDITPEQVQDMTMREIRDLTAALSDGEITDGTGNGTAHSGSGNENSREHKNRENGEESTNNRGRRKHEQQ